MPQPIKIGTRSVPKALWPIFYSPKENEKPTESVIRKRAIEKRPGSIERLSYLALGGIITTAIGAITGVIGFFKDNSLSKWTGAALTFLGVEAFITGFFGSVDLSKKISDSEIRDQKLNNSEIRTETQRDAESENIQKLINSLNENKSESSVLKTLDELTNYLNNSSGLEALNYLEAINPEGFSDLAKSKFVQIQENTKERAKKEFYNDLKTRNIDELSNKYKHGGIEIASIIINAYNEPQNSNYEDKVITCFKAISPNKKIRPLLKYGKSQNTSVEQISSNLSKLIEDESSVTHLISIAQNKHEPDLNIREAAIITLEGICQESNLELNNIQKEKILLSMIELVISENEKELKIFLQTPPFITRFLDENDKAAIASLKERLEKSINKLQENSNDFKTACRIIDIFGDTFANTSKNEIVEFLIGLLNKEIKNKKAKIEIEISVIYNLGKICENSDNETTVNALINYVKNTECPIKQRIAATNAINQIRNDFAKQELISARKSFKKIKGKLTKADKEIFDLIISFYGKEEPTVQSVQRDNTDTVKPSGSETKATQPEIKPAQKPAFPENKKQIILKKLSETSGLATFLRKNNYSQIKPELTAIANDRELNNSKDGVKSRIKAMQCLVEIGGRKTQSNLEEIAKIDPNSQIKRAADQASKLIRHKISKDPNEKRKEEFLRRLKPLVQVGRLVDYSSVNSLLQEFNTKEFKPKLKELLNELSASTIKNFEYFSSNSISPLYVSEFEYDALQQVAKYCLVQIGGVKPDPITPSTTSGTIPVKTIQANSTKRRSTPLEVELKRIAKHFVEPDPKQGTSGHVIGKALENAVQSYCQFENAALKKEAKGKKADSKEETIEITPNNIARKHEIRVQDLYHKLYAITFGKIERFKPKGRV